MIGSEAADLDNRAGRLGRVVQDASVDIDCPLVKVVTIPEREFSLLQGAAAAYVWQSLCKAFPGEVFPLAPDILDLARDHIVIIPNRTPNGLLLPKSETFLSFNLVQGAVAEAFKACGLAAHFSRVQAPCNVRVVDSSGSEETDGRPYSSAKPHTDVWNGEPVSAVLFNIPILGNPAAVKMAYYAPRHFPKELMGPLTDYNLGACVLEDTESYDIPFSFRHIYVSDSLCLHQTVRAADGIRLSIDFRAIPVETLTGEKTSTDNSKADYVDIQHWLNMGSSMVLTSDEPIDAFHRKARGEPVSKVDITTTAIKAVG